MRLVSKKLQTVDYVAEYVHANINGDNSPLEMLSQAPWYIRLLSHGDYCVYKDKIYLPDFHFQLAKSAHKEDRTLATAKLLPVIMFLHDYKSVSLFKMLQYLYSLKYQLHYFLYTFLFLKATKSQFEDIIGMGFIVSRRHWFIRMAPDNISKELDKILAANAK